MPYSANQMYELVLDVAAYPEFLPWCSGVVIHSSGNDVIEATLELERGGIKKSFRTRNTLTPGQAMTLELVDGPFRHLHGLWKFDQLGADGSKVSLDLEFAFENRLTDSLFGRFFEDACNSLVESFTDRAGEIYQ